MPEPGFLIENGDFACPPKALVEGGWTRVTMGNKVAAQHLPFIAKHTSQTLGHYAACSTRRQLHSLHLWLKLQHPVAFHFLAWLFQAKPRLCMSRCAAMQLEVASTLPTTAAVTCTPPSRCSFPAFVCATTCI